MWAWTCSTSSKSQIPNRWRDRSQKEFLAFSRESHLLLLNSDFDCGLNKYYHFIRWHLGLTGLLNVEELWLVLIKSWQQLIALNGAKLNQIVVAGFLIFKCILQTVFVWHFQNDCKPWYAHHRKRRRSWKRRPGDEKSFTGRHSQRIQRCDHCESYLLSFFF